MFFNILQTSSLLYKKYFSCESKFIDALGNCEDIIEIDSEGFGNFKVKGRSTSVWVEMW